MTKARLDLRRLEIGRLTAADPEALRSFDCGDRLLTVDAYPQAVAFYERLGFLRIRSKEYRERTHPSMRLDLFASAMPAWLDA